MKNEPELMGNGPKRSPVSLAWAAKTEVRPALEKSGLVPDPSWKKERS